MTLLEYTKNTIKELETVLNYAQGKLEKAPEGTLYSRIENGMLRYYNRDYRNEKQKYLGEDRQEEVKALEEKAYCQKLVKTAGEELEKLRRIEKILEKNPDWKAVYYELPAERRHLIDPYEINPLKCNERDLERWTRTVKKKNSFPTPNKTAKGEYVKSKSETIIADRLERAGVPYHYEPKLALAELEIGQIFEWHPDFKVLNLRTGREYYWEHFGRMNDPEYFATCELKLRLYAQNGLFMGDNLIITMENPSTPLNTEYVDCLIKRFLV